jgi:glutathione S-transferase
MILIGQYDSPFVRRVGIALRCYGMPFEHRPWSVWGNADEIARYNPLRRVPTLLLDDGSVLVESFSILDALDALAGKERALWPAPGPSRHDAMRIAALCTGICDKAVVLLYASLELMAPSQAWTERCQKQIRETFAVLESDRAARSTEHWCGELLTHADIALACAFRFTSEAHPSLFDPSALPSLAAHAARCEALPEFRDIYLPITNNL